MSDAAVLRKKKKKEVWPSWPERFSREEWKSVHIQAQKRSYYSFYRFLKWKTTFLNTETQLSPCKQTTRGCLCTGVLLGKWCHFNWLWMCTISARERERWESPGVRLVSVWKTGTADSECYSANFAETNHNKFLVPQVCQEHGVCQSSRTKKWRKLGFSWKCFTLSKVTREDQTQGPGVSHWLA